MKGLILFILIAFSEAGAQTPPVQTAPPQSTESAPPPAAPAEGQPAEGAAAQASTGGTGAVSKPADSPRRKIYREKEAEGSEARHRFTSDPIIKSQYRHDGQPLEVDPD